MKIVDYLNKDNYVSMMIFVKELADIEIKNSIIQYQTEALELKQKALELKSENEELKKQLIIKKNLEFNSEEHCYLDKDNSEVRYCQVCYEMDERLSRLKHFEISERLGKHNWCNICRRAFQY